MPSEQSHDTSVSTAGELAIDARNVHVTYADGTEAVQGVDLQVESGEFFGFLGPNGAGKTTTIKTFATLLHPTTGTVLVNGYDVETKSTAVCESIGYMAQETSVDEELTARENIRFASKVYGVPSDERADRVEQLLDLVNLTDVADTRAENFSGGMKKRLDAATVLVHRPPIVFLDEPTTGLDPEARIAFWEYLRRINELGTTVFLTTQYLEEVDRLCDRIGLLQDGQIVTTDTPESLKSSIGGEILELQLEEPSANRMDHAKRAIRQSDVLDDSTVETTETTLRVRAAEVRENASALLVSLHEAGITVTGFEVHSPTLDDVFLELTGSEAVTAEDETETPAVDQQEVAR
ncbi:ABC transporter ATP-binding protein [Haloarcula salinisoli]|uniref:ABC transporter ATP-binding protein n=1 Tax=Haloarcula salinisoli TaxID=2487746 RepID=A0A8J8C9W1_9EURY|nr:ABC transporter ATP-binding protein [Halomicroarcula salinisoli]MBX0288609.1 ABC transporter ATP-binding protein [Halomicroarcula salinisoli]MBX0306011.1 ABC transporter ATP-binding protein [Halomicroarcula salinisoli]